MISDNQCLHVVSDERKACFFFLPLHFSQSVCVLKHGALHWFSPLRGPTSLFLCRSRQLSPIEMFKSQLADTCYNILTSKSSYSPIKPSTTRPLPTSLASFTPFWRLALIVLCISTAAPTLWHSSLTLHWPEIIKITTHNTHSTAFMFNQSFILIVYFGWYSPPHFL